MTLCNFPFKVNVSVSFMCKYKCLWLTECVITDRLIERLVKTEKTANLDHEMSNYLLSRIGKYVFP